MKMVTRRKRSEKPFAVMSAHASQHRIAWLVRVIDPLQPDSDFELEPKVSGSTFFKVYSRPHDPAIRLQVSETSFTQRARACLSECTGHSSVPILRSRLVLCRS